MTVKQRLLAAGVELLHDQGLGALTQPRVAKAAGVSQSHLTYYFPSRNELLLAIAEHSVDMALARHLETSTDDPLAALAQAIGFLPRARMLLGLVTASDQDPAIRAAVDRLVAHLRASLGHFFRHLGYSLAAPQVLVVHAAIVGLAVMNLGRQSEGSAQEIEVGLKQLLALLPPPDPTARRA